MTIPKEQFIFWVLLMLAIVCLYELRQRIKPFELFVDDGHSGRWVLEHVDPAWGNAGLLIPVVRDGVGSGGGAVGPGMTTMVSGAMVPAPAAVFPMPAAVVPMPAPVAVAPAPAAVVPMPAPVAVVPVSAPAAMEPAPAPAPAAMAPAPAAAAPETTTVTPVETSITFAPGKSYTAKNGNVYFGDEVVYICGINWSGIESFNNVGSLQEASITEHVALLKQYGFNAIRVTMNAQAMTDLDAQKPKNISEGKNPDLVGKSVGYMLDKVITSCAEAGILVMLNMYNREPAEDLTPVWYTDKWPESALLVAWQNITTRYVNFPNVFAMDILNEPHGKLDNNNRATWGDGGKNDFKKWCETAGAAILAINPNVLICVGGIEYVRYGDDVSGASTQPVVLPVPDKVFYSPHIYQLDPAWLLGMPEKTFQGYLAKVIGTAVDAGLTVVLGEYGYSTNEARIAKESGNDKYYSVSSQKEYVEQLTAYCNSIGLTNAFYWDYTHDARLGLSIHQRNDTDGTLALLTDKLEQIMKLQSKKTWIKFVA